MVTRDNSGPVSGDVGLGSFFFCLCLNVPVIVKALLSIPGSSVSRYFSSRWLVSEEIVNEWFKVDIGTVT